MKKHLLKFLLTFAIALSIGWVNGQTIYTENFDVDANWSGGTMTGYNAKTYVNSVSPAEGTFSTNDAVRETTNVNSGAFAFRTDDEATAYLRYEIDNQVNSFSVYIARWDNSPSPNFTIRYSTNSGNSYTDIETLDGSWFTADKIYKKYSHTFSTPITPESGQTIYIELYTNSGERLLYDDFEVSLGETADTQAPQATFSPANSENGVEINSNITITFDELIYKSDGTTEIVDGDLATLITLKETDAAGADVTFTATYSNIDPFVITIDPTSDLGFNTDYYVAFGSVYDNIPNENTGENATFTTKPDTDKNSIVVAPGTQISAANIESIVTDSIPVFAFTVSDLGTADGLETKITQLILKAGPNNTIAFNENLRGGYLLDATDTEIPFAAEPVVTADDITITFNVGDFNVADGTDATYTVYLQIDTANTIDGSVIQMMIDADAHGLTADATGSEFAADFTSDVVGNDITINVTATEIQFTEQPEDTYPGENLSDVIVSATDINGNVDTDYITDISITATGATLNNSPVTATPIDGVATFDALSFSNAGTVTLTAASGAFTNATSNTFSILETTDLYFSEYIEGGSNRKALEIHNPTNAAVSLNNYRIAQGSNGGDWAYWHTFPTDVEIAAGDVYVIITTDVDDPYFNPANADEVLAYPSVVHHNGDDARAIEKTSDGGTNWTIIDIIGKTEGVDPGSGWDVAGIAAATANHTLLRKPGITHGNTNWIESAGTNTDDSEWKVYDQDFFTNLGALTPDASSEAEIKTFELPGLELTSAIIDNDLSTVTLEILKDSSLVDRKPVITVSEGATIDPTSGTPQDFTSAVDYTVTAEDGITERVWTVTVTVSATASSFAEILDMEIDGTTNIVINSTEGTITADVPYAYDVKSVKPVFGISAAATIADTLNARDFTTPQTYVVTAQDASTKDWEITINVFAPEEVTVYDIQYTADASGDSPYFKDQIITSGIVTAIGDGTLWIQDGTGAWNGVYIFSNTTASAVALGDEIKFAAEVDEYFGLTELKNVLGLEILSSENTLPEAIVIAENTALTEEYEGVLIKVENLEVTELDGEHGILYTATNGTETVYVDNEIYTQTEIVVADKFNITGIVNYSWSNFRLSPRTIEDIEEVVIEGIDDLELNSVKLYPNPSNGLVTLELNNANNEQLFVEVYDVIGKMVYKTQITENVTNIDLTQMNAGIYYVSVNNNNNKKVSKIMIQ